MEKFRASERNVNLGEDWEVFWEFEADEDLRAGSQLSSDPAANPLRPDEKRSQPRIRKGDAISIFVKAADGESILGIYRIPSNGLSDVAWLQTDGSVTDKPCPL